MSDAARLSRLLFEARERIEMAADSVEYLSGKPDKQGRRLVAEIDAYRAERGWSPHGFGGEEDDDVLLREAQWLETAHANSADKGYSVEYRRGFAAAAGWVRFHAENLQRGGEKDET